jgi:serine/threonine-protein kinase
MTQSFVSGDRIAGKYRILKTIGQGGMGTVYLAQHERLNRQVAVKVLHSELLETDEAVTRFEREIQAMALVRHRHVAEALDADVLDDGSPFLVMEYLEGRDLRAELKLRRAIPYREAVAYVIQACEGVAAVHDVGIIHRDLKPHNLFVENLTGARCVKVLDFGVAKFLSGIDVSMTATDKSVGTPLYMSPEQLSRPKDVSPITDVWSLGVVLYELIAGVSPFAGEGPGAVVAAIMLDEPALLSRVVPDVPVALSDVVVDALVKSPANRIGSVRELASKLLPFGLPIEQLIVSSTTTSRRPIKVPLRASLRPDLSARIMKEVERHSENLPIGQRNTRSDQLRRIPNLAAFSIPLTSAATPLALLPEVPLSALEAGETLAAEVLEVRLPKNPLPRFSPLPKSPESPNFLSVPALPQAFRIPKGIILGAFLIAFVTASMIVVIVLKSNEPGLSTKTPTVPLIPGSAVIPVVDATARPATTLVPPSPFSTQAELPPVGSPTESSTIRTTSAKPLNGPRTTATRSAQSSGKSRPASSASPIPSAIDRKPLHL